MRAQTGIFGTLVIAMALIASPAWAADDGAWSVSKSSGEVWIATSGAQPVSLNPETTLKQGDTIRTGRNGRVLLVRGEESILVAPNSVIGLPTERKDGMSTTVLQQAGSILLEVEKLNVKHFEVETPYLAAVVKGTQFVVTIDGATTRVDVKRGQVEVSDFKSGQIAQVMPGQSATAFEHGKPGLSLSGSGKFLPIEHGKPRASSIERVHVPKGGLGPRMEGNKSMRASGPNSLRISSALCEVRLNIHKATHGLAHGVGPTVDRSASRDLAKDTIWGGGDNKASPANANASANSSSSETAGASGNPGNSASTAAAIVAATVGSANANGNANGVANGLGLGNGGVGNGNGRGNARH